MKRLKSYLSFHWKISLIFYFIVYMIKTFVEWEFKNPFRWIIDLPTYEGNIRGFILFGFVIYEILLLITFIEEVEPKQKKEIK